MIYIYMHIDTDNDTKLYIYIVRLKFCIFARMYLLKNCMFRIKNTYFQILSTGSWIELHHSNNTIKRVRRLTPL